MNWRLIRLVDSLLGKPIILLLSILFRNRNNITSLPAGISLKKILLVKFWGIGNIFMLLPTIRALRDAFPEAEIDFLTLDSNIEALNALGAVSRIITIDTRSVRRFLRSWKTAVMSLSAAVYDVAIDFEQFARFSSIIIFQAGVRRTIGFVTRKQHRHYLYSSVVKYDNRIHITRSFYALAEAAGVKRPFSIYVHLDRLHTLRSEGERLLRSHNVSRGNPVVVMHIGTSDNFKERRWPPSYYAALADLLIRRFRSPIIMTGLKEEAFLITETRRYLNNPEGVIDLGGRLSFTDYCSLISAADLVISADTSAVHLASAMNVRVVGLYGPNTPELYGPWGTGGLFLYSNFDCSPCITNYNSKINTCRHADGNGACMRALTVDLVFEAVEKVLCEPHALYNMAKFAKTESESCIA